MERRWRYRRDHSVDTSGYSNSTYGGTIDIDESISHPVTDGWPTSMLL